MNVTAKEVAAAHNAYKWLRVIGARVTSPIDIRYNCIAWSLNVRTRWYWPEGGAPKPGANNNGKPGHTWPLGDRDATLRNFQQFYKTKGFVPCDDGQLVRGTRKVVLYVYVSKRNGKTFVSHASKQLPDGKWASKLGADVDIVHVRPEDLLINYKGHSVEFLEKKPRVK